MMEEKVLLGNRGNEIKLNRKQSVLITVLVTIVVWSIVIAFGYQWMTYYQCRHSNTVLYGYDQGLVEKIIEESQVGELPTGRWHYYENGEMSHVIDNGMGYMKIYRNNILISLSVDDSLADLKSYFNPRFWITGERMVRANKVYEIRDESAYQKALKQLEENTVPEQYLLKIGAEYFVN